MNKSDHFIFGRKPIEELLKHKPETIEKIYLRNGLKSTDLNYIKTASSENRIPVVDVPGSKLMELVGKVNDQGVVAAISEVEYHEFDEWIDEFEPQNNSAVLLLDEIEDPHNFGAILRTAAAAGMTAVIVPKHRQAPVNQTVFKTSAGTAGRIPIIRTVNLNQAILKLKDNSFWIAGLSADGPSTIWQETYDVPMAFVIGNEGRGIRKKTSEHCDFLLNIPMFNKVESLNASVSAGLICFEWRRQQEI